MVKLLFTGDFATVGRCVSHMADKTDEVFVSIMDIIYDCDLHITNLECQLTNSFTPILKTGPAIKSSPDTIRFFSAAQVGVACMANNHIRDFDDQGVKDTLTICKTNEISTVGAGLNRQEAAAILYKEVHDVKIAFLNYCETEFSIAGENTAGANPIDYLQLYNDVKQAKENSDYIIVIYHGGNEYYPLPNIRIKKFFHLCVDLGADAVIGHHTHVFSGFEIYKKKPLVYSLGNFLFDEPDNTFRGWFLGLMARITLVDGNISLELIPIRQEKSELKLSIVAGSDKEDILNEIKRLSGIIEKDEALINAYKIFCSKRGEDLVRAISNLSFLQKATLKAGSSLLKVIGHKRLLQILNLIQCESHRDLIITSIKTETSI